MGEHFEVLFYLIIFLTIVYGALVFGARINKGGKNKENVNHINSVKKLTKSGNHKNGKGLCSEAWNQQNILYFQRSN